MSLKQIYFTDIIFYVSACQFRKKVQCWHKNYMSINEISIFGLIFFIFRYHWHNNFTSAIKSFNHLLLFFWVFDVCFLRQWLQFYVFSFIFSGPDITFLRQHSFLPGADIFFLCHCNDFLRFSCTDICFFMSVQRISQKACFFDTTDIKILCQRHHRVTVLAPVWLNSLKIKKFCLEAEAERFLNCKQCFS